MIITDQSIYNGRFIHGRFAYTYFRQNASPCGNIVTFIAPAKVEETGMIDIEDVLSKEFIYSDKMINFCWEIPIIQDCFGAVSFQRLFNSGIANIISKYVKKPIMVDGDDIMVIDRDKEKKASVSIAHMVDGAAIGHTGININAGPNAPLHAYSTNLDENSAISFINDVESYFTWMTRDIFIATTKIVSR